MDGVGVEHSWLVCCFCVVFLLPSMRDPILELPNPCPDFGSPEKKSTTERT